MVLGVVAALVELDAVAILVELGVVVSLELSFLKYALTEFLVCVELKKAECDSHHNMEYIAKI